MPELCGDGKVFYFSEVLVLSVAFLVISGLFFVPTIIFITGQQPSVSS